MGPSWLLSQLPAARWRGGCLLPHLLKSPRLPPTLFQGEGKLEPQTWIYWSGPNLPIWGEHSDVQGPLQSGLGLQPVSPHRGSSQVCPAWEKGNIRAALEVKATPTLEQNCVSDKGFEVNKVLKACPVVCACWGFPLQLVWLWGLVGHRRFGNSKRQRCLSASADWGSQYILPPQKLSFQVVGPSPNLAFGRAVFPCFHHHQSILATLSPW